ncbi:hypothetical protein [Rhizobium tubonense]|uniref:Uncharacterized protein n=1 Tax=Rhizobium tubonense TaxID=484088 RepID=A0A2W4CPD5_9HYPH|nr:hypothetical protein [Rhizobium tubonense]PZM12838.1 hypothetical protein CPY51_14875 [Rhizobium tubonense]
MTNAEVVIERALAVVAKSRASRERDEQRRKEVFSRIQVGRTLEAYQVKRGEQLSLKLDS